MVDPMDPNVIVISQTAQWEGFPNPRQNVDLDVIVDPMIYRTADVFLRGKGGVSQGFRNPGEVWKAMKRNVDSLAMFFDSIILSRNLPIIDYGVTFEEALGLGKTFLMEECNQDDEILISVHVSDEASETARNAALESMKDRTAVPEAMTAELVQDMTALEYQWQPDLSALGNMSETDLAVNRFLYGAALFSNFARCAGLGHIFQPKRSKIYLAASLHADSETAQDDNQLYAKLKQIMTEASGDVSPIAELDGLPPFLPYLLSKDAQMPKDLLSEAFKLRDTGMVKDYRDLRHQLIRDWREEGKIRNKYRQQLRAIAAKVQKELHGESQSSGMELKVNMTGIDPSWKIPVEKIWGWVQSQLPGRRYIKLLTRLMLSGAEYEKIDRHIEKIWLAA